MDEGMTRLNRSRILEQMQHAPVAAPRSRFAWLIATFFGVGHLQPGSGTWAAAITAVAWWAVGRNIPSSWLLPVSVWLALVVTLIGIAPSTVVARESGRKDPGFVVIDEVAGQMIAMIGLPLNWKYLLASFILFRSFDIVKPFPLRRLERLPAGTGIMMDDVGAGLYALVLLQVGRHFLG